MKCYTLVMEIYRPNNSFLKKNILKNVFLIVQKYNIIFARFTLHWKNTCSLVLNIKIIK